MAETDSANLPMCPKCFGNMSKHGKSESGNLRHQCVVCGFRTTAPIYIIRHVIFADTHAPNENRSAINAALEYIKDYKPHKMIAAGDIGDFNSVSHWIKNKRLSSEGCDLGADIDCAVNILDLFSESAPAAKKIVLLGNHEKWVMDYADEHSELRSMVDIGEAYGDAGWDVIGMNELYGVGKLNVTHGLFVGKYHAHNTVHSLSASCMYGHTHDHQVYTESFIDGEKMAMSIGCLCNMNPKYLKNRPKKWVHGFATVDVISNGDFFIDFIKIIKGRFSRNGKIYDGK